MKWPEPIRFSQPPRDVRIKAPLTMTEVEALIKAHEKTAYERGVMDGEKRLSEMLLQQRAELLELQNGVIASLQKSVADVIHQSESTLIELALEIAQKLVGDMPVSVEMIESAIRSALAQTEEATEFSIYLHQDDLALLQKTNSPLLQPNPNMEKVQYHTSPDISRGGCMVHTRFGIIDARRETKLDLLKQSLMT